MENNTFSKNITSFDDHLDKQYGKVGSESRENFEQGFETFKLGVILEEARKKKNLTLFYLIISYLILFNRVTSHHILFRDGSPLIS